MAEICSCDSGIKNHGQPSCIPSFGRDSRLIFVPQRDNDGNLNRILSSDTLTSSDIEGKLYNTDTSKRWQMTPTINQVQGERAESVKQDIDGIQFNVRQGQRSYDGTFYGNIANPVYQDAFDSMKCKDMAYYIVDVNGNLIGMYNSTDDALEPIKIQRNTLDAIYSHPSASEVQSLQIMFMVEENERDANLRMISSADFGPSLLNAKSMVTVEFGTATSISTTGFTIPMTYVYGEAFDHIDYEGAVIGDFTLLDNASSAITITSVTESSSIPGTYVFVIPTQSAGITMTMSYQKTTSIGAESRTDASISIPT